MYKRFKKVYPVYIHVLNIVVFFIVIKPQLARNDRLIYIFVCAYAFCKKLVVISCCERCRQFSINCMVFGFEGLTSLHLSVEKTRKTNKV